MSEFWLATVGIYAAMGLSCFGVKSIKDGNYYWAAIFFTQALTMAVGVGVGVGMDLSKP